MLFFNTFYIQQTLLSVEVNQEVYGMWYNFLSWIIFYYIFTNRVCVMTPCIPFKINFLYASKNRGNVVWGLFFEQSKEVIFGITVQHIAGRLIFHWFFLYFCVYTVSDSVWGGLLLSGVPLYMFLKVKYENKKRDVYICMYYIVKLKINNLCF